MKPALVAVLGVAAFTGLLLLVDGAEAQLIDDCANDGDVCRGKAYTIRSVAGGTRAFCFQEINTGGTGGCSNGAGDIGNTWQLDAGGSITLHYIQRTELLPPPAPSNVILRVLFDDSTSSVRTFHNGAPPASGTQYTFWATTDGTSTGDPRAGTYRLFVEASVGGIGAYTVNSDGTGGDEALAQKGALQSRMLVASLTDAGPPAGSIYAYGATTDESVVINAGFTPPNGDGGVETMRLGTALDGVPVETGSAVDVDTGALQQAFVVDNTYPADDYDATMEVIGNADLTDVVWTIYATSGHGAGLVRNTAILMTAADDWTADPGIRFSPDTTSGTGVVNTDETVYNRNETVSYDFWLLNARDEQLTRSMTIEVRSAAGIVVDSQAQTGPTYNGSYLIAVTDPAIHDTTGDLAFFRATNTDQSQDSQDAHGVSDLYFVDVHPQKDIVLDKDDFPTQDATEDHTYIISSDIVRAWVHVEGVRLDDTEIDTTGQAVMVRLYTPNQDLSQSQDTDTQSDGWANGFGFTPSAPAGTWHLNANVAFAGNTGDDNETLQFVSAFTANLVLRLHFPPTVEPNVTVPIYVRTEVDDVGTEPDGVPVLKVSRVKTTTIPPSWEDVQALVSMVNVVDWTSSVNGSLYQFNFTPPTEGVYNVWVRAPLQSAPIRENTNLLQVQEGFAMPTDINLDLTPELANFISLILLTGLLLFLLDRKAILPAATVTIAGLLLVIPIVTDPLAWGVIGLYLFLWLHYAAKNGLTQVGRDDREGV